jgi:hypothetical protein
MAGLRPGPADDLGEPIVVDEGTLARTETPQPVPLDVAARGSGARPTQQSIADQIVGFARRNLDDRVGDGECFALADRALRRAGAKTARDFGEITPEADYVWGTPVPLADLQPGDIVQFRDYQMDLESQSPTETRTERQTRPHHTAIVESVAAGGPVTVLEQNVPERTGVKRRRLFLASGTTTNGDTTTTVAVQGTLWFYRPQPR